MVKAKRNKGHGKWWWIGSIAFIVIIALWIGGTYNSLVGLDEGVDNAWGKVQSAYQRRADLIPNIVQTVKAYTDYEGPLLKDITEARASVGRAGTPKELAAAGGAMDSAISRLLVTVENYPDLKASENFLSLQDELAGTENRVKVERDNFNNAVKGLNVKTRRFPSNIIAGWFGFEEKEYFESEEGADKAPEVGEMFA
jgi:LemA protein